jgi:hypothetical protein
MNAIAQRTAPAPREPAHEPGAALPNYPDFAHLTPEEQDEFEDICDFIIERAAILEYEANMTREAAEAEAERLALDRYPPGEAARVTIHREANRIANHYGLTDWSAGTRLSEDQIRRLHVNHGYWLSLCDYFHRVGETRRGKA